jgi:hypothetical protein
MALMIKCDKQLGRYGFMITFVVKKPINNVLNVFRSLRILNGVNACLLVS